VRICFNDYDREMALVAELKVKGAENEILGVGRLTKERGLNEAEFAMLVADKWQKQGLGTELLRRLLTVAETENLTRVTAEILADNHGMKTVVNKLGFKVTNIPESADVMAEYVVKK
jgi:acetyltransferase